MPVRGSLPRATDPIRVDQIGFFYCSMALRLMTKEHDMKLRSVALADFFCRSTAR